MMALKVGICVAESPADLDAALWSSSLGQRIVFLVMLFKRLTRVDEIVLVSTVLGGEDHLLGGLAGAAVITREAALEHLDVIIELNTRAFDIGEIETFRARGGKLVSYIAGNILAGCFEEFGSVTPHGDLPFLPKYDAAWVEAQHWPMCHSYAQLVTSPLAAPAPHLWTPHFVNTEAAASRTNPFFRPPENNAWTIGVFDPNASITRTFQMSLLVAEEADRLRPDLIAGVRLFNAYRLRENKHLTEMFACIDLGLQSKVTVEVRHRLLGVMGFYIHAVVTHQWNDPLHYSYWETLYLGWPLIHNSPAIETLGYYYPEFDPQTGGEVMVEALEGHADRLPASREALRDRMWAMNPDNPILQRAYADLLDSVMSSGALS